MTTEVREVQLGQNITQNGAATLEHVETIQRLVDAVRELQAFRTAVEAVTKPTGGAVVDAEARTAINAIIDA